MGKYVKIRMETTSTVIYHGPIWIIVVFYFKDTLQWDLWSCEKNL